LIELVGNNEAEIIQGGLKFLDGMFEELKKEFEKQYNIGSETWILSDTNISKLREEMIKIIGSDKNTQRIIDDTKKADLNNIFSSKKTSSKKETNIIELTKELKEKATIQLKH